MITAQSGNNFEPLAGSNLTDRSSWQSQRDIRSMPLRLVGLKPPTRIEPGSLVHLLCQLQEENFCK